MLVVKVEIWPGGDSERAYEIDRLYAGNVSRLAPTSNYVWELKSGGEGELKGHRRTDGAWVLIEKILRKRRLQEKNLGRSTP